MCRTQNAEEKQRAAEETCETQRIVAEEQEQMVHALKLELETMKSNFTREADRLTDLVNSMESEMKELSDDSLACRRKLEKERSQVVCERARPLSDDIHVFITLSDAHQILRSSISCPRIS